MIRTKAILLIGSVIMTAPAHSNMDDIPVTPINEERISNLEITNAVDNAIYNAVTKNLDIPTQNNVRALQQTSQYEIQPGAYAQQPEMILEDSTPSSTMTKPTLPEIAGRDPVIDELRKKYKSHQKVNIKPGHSELIPVALGLQNRIGTEFTNVSVKTSDLKTPISVEDGYIYVTPVGNSPLSLMIGEMGMPETMVNLTLMPLDVPPVMVKLDVKMDRKMSRAHKAYLSEQAIIAEKKAALTEINLAPRVKNDPRINTEHPDRVTALLTDVALGNTPRGYQLNTDIDIKDRHPCNINQLMMYHEVGQRLIGSREIIDVVIIKNDINGQREVREEFCFGPDVIAVAVFDKAVLNQDESTELYILRDKLYAEKQRKSRQRPRLTARN